MTPPKKNNLLEELETPKGVVRIYQWCSPRFTGSHEMEAGLGTFPSYRSIFASPEALARVVGDGENNNMLLGLDAQDKIVAYCAFREALAGDFWGRLGPGTLYEIAALEVSRQYRGTRLGKQILHLGLVDPIIETFICYMVGYSWTWDLEGTGMTANDYRRMLMKLLEPYKFKRYPTNEPNVSLRPENIFMARIGENISEEFFKKFKNLLFGIIT